MRRTDGLQEKTVIFFVRKHFALLSSLAVAVLATLAPATPVAGQRIELVGAEATLTTEALSPDAWSTGMHRAFLAGGVRFDRLELFGAGSAFGAEYGRIAPGTRLFVATGVDTTFMLPTGSDAPGAEDSVEIAFPDFVAWDDDATNPFDRSDSADVLLRGSYGSGTSACRTAGRARSVCRAR
jgi:hypothetical protein